VFGVTTFTNSLGGGIIFFLLQFCIRASTIKTQILGSIALAVQPYRQIGIAETASLLGADATALSVRKQIWAQHYRDTHSITWHVSKDGRASIDCKHNTAQTQLT